MILGNIYFHKLREWLQTFVFGIILENRISSLLKQFSFSASFLNELTEPPDPQPVECEKSNEKLNTVTYWPQQSKYPNGSEGIGKLITPPNFCPFSYVARVVLLSLILGKNGRKLQLCAYNRILECSLRHAWTEVHSCLKASIGNV